MGAGRFGLDDAESFFLSYTVGERERVGVLPEHRREARLFQQIVLVGVRNCPPIITGLQGTLRRVDRQFVVHVLNIPLSWKLDQPIQISFLGFGVELALVVRCQVMTNMHELGALKDFLILSYLHVSAHKPAHPVIGDYRGREHFQLATRF